VSAPDERLALFVMLGRTVEQLIQENPATVPPESLNISETVNLAVGSPAEVRIAIRAASVYKLFFVFENYLRELVMSVLTEKYQSQWWDKVEPNVQKDVKELQEKEETKLWMALQPRDQLALVTYPQLLVIMEHCWKDVFEPVVRDKQLISEARRIGHLRNAICHMTDIPDEEVERVKQLLRDWFRVVPF
jgi:Swt1-like HEPN